MAVVEPAAGNGERRRRCLEQYSLSLLYSTLSTTAWCSSFNSYSHSIPSPPVCPCSFLSQCSAIPLVSVCGRYLHCLQFWPVLPTISQC